MLKTKSTKRALIMSGLALLLCVSMLVGSTFAWFTDTVTSAGNKIVAGNLKVDLARYDVETDTWNSIKESSDPIFNYDKWEPGYTDVQLLKIENQGSLALKWVAKFISAYQLSALANVIDVYVCPSATELSMPGRDLTGYIKVGSVADFVNSISQTTNGSLEAGQSAYLGIALKMQETAGNEYQGMDLGGAFDIMILATQYTSEEDSFGDQYDANAEFGAVYTQSVVFEPGVSQVEAEIRNDDDYKVAYVLIPAAAVAEGATEANIIITPTDADANIVVAAGQEVKTFDIKVLGLKENNTEELTVGLRIPVGLDPATVTLYHYDEEIACSYNPNNGYVTFESSSFSPFTVVYDAESEYEAPEVEESELPVAIVTPYTDIDNIEWGNFGQFSPSEGLQAELETAYVFQCKETPEEAEQNPYAQWYCDFYVSLDRDLGENQIFLGGNYGSFGWIGFHNGDVTLPANQELPLLGSVTQSPWTYASIAYFVNEFICGVGDVDDALAGATFTVKLRLTNPEDADDFYDVATIEYIFP